MAQRGLGPRALEVDRSSGSEVSELLRGFKEHGKGRERVVACGICRKRIGRSVVPHMKDAHPTEWKKWVAKFIELRAEGYTYKQIMWQFRRLFSWSVIRREIFPHDPLLFGEVEVREYQPKDFKLEETSLWRFPRRGDWATHTNLYPGNWPPQVPRNLILRYSRAGELVLDPFAGSGTTIIECVLLGRNAIGTDISPSAIRMMEARIEGLKVAARRQRYALPRVKTVTSTADARDLGFIKTGSVDLICTHPPYLSSIKYSKWIHDDLSRISELGDYMTEFRPVVEEWSRVLKPRKYCAMMIGDVRKEGKQIHLGLGVLRLLEASGFELEEVVIKEQMRSSHDEFYSRSDFLRLAHEYIFVLRKSRAETPNRVPRLRGC